MLSLWTEIHNGVTNTAFSLLVSSLEGLASNALNEKGKRMALNFLDKQLGKLLQPPKPKWMVEEEKREKKYYMRLRRLCQKHGITYNRT